MSDTVYFLQLPGAQLESIERGEDQITLHFSRVHLVQEMEGAFEDSIWTQAVKLIIKGAALEGELPECPCELSGGDLSDNIYVYRDQVPLPINWQGEVACTLNIAGTDTRFSISAERLQLEQLGHPRYVKHISKR